MLHKFSRFLCIPFKERILYCSNAQEHLWLQQPLVEHWHALLINAVPTTMYFPFLPIYIVNLSKGRNRIEGWCCVRMMPTWPISCLQRPTQEFHSNSHLCYQSHSSLSLTFFVLKALLPKYTSANSWRVICPRCKKKKFALHDDEHPYLKKKTSDIAVLLACPIWDATFGI